MKQKLLLTLLALVGLSQAAAQETERLPIVREGVQWVNEKVIVNNGDTTCYYYKYEICGDDTTWDKLSDSGSLFKACYYYTGETLDVEKDSLIAGLDNVVSPNGMIRGVTCGRNNAYWNADRLFNLDQIVSILHPDIYLYWFDHVYGNPNLDLIDYYILICQQTFCPPEDWVLTRENFTQVESVEIEGFSCRRWAYVKENGDTMCYVVEGIGFDSWCMGDLLTPFTREPDHNAAHQEWCGLSHVVKDGQIIYKGMRYRHGAFTGIDEAVTDKTQRPQDPRYYDLMGRPVGTEVPSTPGIYIHQGKKIVVR